VTLVHKGNIMKFTEGAFRDWGYELAKEEFGERTLTEDELDRFGQLLSYGTDVDDFWTAVDAALRLFLQHPEMIYRVEIGEPHELPHP